MCDYPVSVVVRSSSGERAYLRDETLTAVEVLDRSAHVRGAIVEDRRHQFVLMPTESVAGAESAELRPVYRLAPSGPPCVPTGRVFIELDHGCPAKALGGKIGELGYDMFKYALNTAWLKSRSGHLNDALQAVSRLGGLPGIRVIEPQFISERHFKAR